MQEESIRTQYPQEKADKKSIKISIKTAMIIAVILVIGALAYFYKGLLIAATVNGSPISRLAVIKEVEKASGKNALDSLITKKLIENEVRAKKITISDDEVNNEIDAIKVRVAGNPGGGSLEVALAAQSMTMNDLKDRILLQKRIEKLIADKLNVTDEEVAQFVKDNKVSITKGQEAAMTDQIKSQIRNQKLNAEAKIFIDALKSKAKIMYFVNY